MKLCHKVVANQISFSSIIKHAERRYEQFNLSNENFHIAMNLMSGKKGRKFVMKDFLV